MKNHANGREKLLNVHETTVKNVKAKKCVSQSHMVFAMFSMGNSWKFIEEKNAKFKPLPPIYLSMKPGCISPKICFFQRHAESFEELKVGEASREYTIGLRRRGRNDWDLYKAVGKQPRILHTCVSMFKLKRCKKFTM